jgi:hypothetical protein
MTNQGAKGRVEDYKGSIVVSQEDYLELLSENRRLKNHLEYLKGVMKTALKMME